MLKPALHVALLMLLVDFAHGAEHLSQLFDLPAGFEIEQFADNDLAHDIFALTFNPRGQVVVSGPGYVKTLIDDNGDGRADRAELFSGFPASGAQGLCFDGDTLWLTGDNALARLIDHDGDGVAEGPPEIVARLRGGEHGAHAILIGPDGCLYVLCGNDAGVKREHAAHAESPIRDPRCGAILRFTRDGRQSQVIAHGFRNPYDMAFSADGDLYTVDSDGERDNHLPWYAATRLFDVGWGLEHGWLAGGWTNSWSRPEHFFDNVSRVAEMGRGSPTGMVCYQHQAFPARYHGGLFAADWTFGRVYFVPLRPCGSTVSGQPELFLQSRGADGFAPVDLAISPNGELFVAIGGRRTRGGVYRVRAVEAESPALTTDDPLAQVLGQADPLSSWARARWQPLAQSLGAEPFRAAVADRNRTVGERVRAVEVLVDQFDGIDTTLAQQTLAEGNSPLIARIAWALGLSDDQPAASELLAQLTASDDPRVARAAWQALLLSSSTPETSPDYLQAVGSRDRRIRALALQYAARRDSERFSEAIHHSDDPLSFERSVAWHIVRGAQQGTEQKPDPSACHAVADLFCEIAQQDAFAPQLALDALRLIQLELGDIQIERSTPAEPVGYVGRNSSALAATLRTQLATRLAEVFPVGQQPVDYELARLLAMLGCDHPELPRQLLTFWTDDSLPADDLHYLFALSRLHAPRSEEVTQATANALLQLHRKLRQRGELTSRTWPDRVSDLVAGLCQRDPQLAGVMVSNPQFGMVEHALFALQFSAELQQQAARRLLAASRDDELSCSDETIQLLATLPAEEVVPRLREIWDEVGSPTRVVRILATHARPEDAVRLIAGLAVIDDETVRQCAVALAQMPADHLDQGLTAAWRALSRYCEVRPAKQAMPSDPQVWPQADVRAALLGLIEAWSGNRFDVDETKHDHLRAAYRPVSDWLASAFPEAASHDSAAQQGGAWLARLDALDWSQGDVDRGQAIYQKQSCHRCHAEAGRAGNQRLGPDLAGAAERFSRFDLFAAIVDPSASVAPAFRTTQIVTRSGQVYHGLVVYESPEGTMLQTGPDTVVRITGEELLAMLPSDRSLMPDGLLTGLSDIDLADLYAYLRTLKASR